MNAKKAATNKAAKKKPAGRPSSFTQAKADAICERLAKGESLRSICAEATFPDQTTVYRWLRDVESFRLQYTRAREDQAETLFDQMVTIADTPVIGTKTVTKATGVEMTEGDMIEHRRLQVETRKWVLGKLAPKKYGEKQQIEHSGSVTLEALIAGAGDE